jgi:hypothetical protein
METMMDRAAERGGGPDPGPDAPPYLALEGLSAAYGDARAVDDVTLEVGQGDLVA